MYTGSFTPCRQTLIKFTHVLCINLRVMTPIQINASDSAVCKWVLWLDAAQLQLLKERNDSGRLRPAFLPLSALPHSLICPWIYSCYTGACLPSASARTCTLQPRPRLGWTAWPWLTSCVGCVDLLVRSAIINARDNSTQIQSDGLLLETNSCGLSVH